ncbi:hypothetical protein BpHYR1_052874 [Brachionus plicatilis]|uniref:Uncharacterized protein n=1 Tax=Brachionus plicatilis TaxID=10195 RepID=A0A3M7RIP6_BRAPC|nr:hypothetical protein BpHYR1_052874 [Brachionus plicatilis]
MSAEHNFKKALRRYRDGDMDGAIKYFRKASRCSDAHLLENDWKDLVRDKGLSTSEIIGFIEININIENLNISCNIQ